jgi:hypothetical protein
MGIPVFDIEAMEWVHPIAVGFTDGDTYFEFLKETPDTDVMWKFLEFVGKKFEGMSLFAHNAGNYDNRFILDSLVRHKQKIRLEAGLGRVVWLDKDVSFEDSLLVVGTSLATLCKAFGVPRKLSWDHSTTVNIWELGSRLDSFRTYLKRDVMSLSMAMDAYCRSLIQNFGITPSATLSLTAVKAFNKNFFPVSGIKANEAFEPYIRAATYGGRNEVYKRYGEGLYLYDIRSMYISCYNAPIPIGEMHWRKPSMEYGSLAEATVEVPKDKNIGPLPYKWYGRLIFPVGKFTGWWDMVELRKAESEGAKISLLRQLDCEELPVLKEFGDYVSHLRYSSTIELGRLWKLMGIRLSGKFGQHRWRTEIVHSDDIEDFTGFTPMDASEVYHEKSVYLKGNKAPYVRPAVAMRIRAESRVRHLTFLLKSDPYYCDTDSVYTTTQLPIGEAGGELQLTGLAKRAYFVRGKLYGYVDHNGNLKQRAAGFRDFRLTEYDFQQLLAGKDIEYLTRPVGKWKAILNEQGVNLDEIPRKAKGGDSIENRITDGSVTHPICLPITEKRKSRKQ